MKQTQPLQIGFLGECMVELKGDPEQSVSLGYSGDSLNTAVYFSRCSQGANVASHYLTAIGTDAFSATMLKRWQQENIGCDYIRQLADKHPGIYFIHVDEHGERSFSYWREQSAAKLYFDGSDADALIQRLTQLDGLYLSGISLAILPPESREKLFQLLAALKANGGKIYFDNNYRPKLWPNADVARQVYTRILALCDIAFLTLDDEAALFATDSASALIDRLAPLAIPEIVIKCGADDCVIVRDGESVFVPAVKVAKVVDTTAAGDSFSAAYLAARLQGLPAQAAAQAGHTLAATVIQHEGAIIDRQLMPTDLMGNRNL